MRCLLVSVFASDCDKKVIKNLGESCCDGQCGSLITCVSSDFDKPIYMKDRAFVPPELI
jgi:hypothetical protein